MRRALISSIVIICISVFVFSCKKSVEDKIDGTWRMINVGNLTSDDYVEWELNNGYIYMLQTQSGNPTLDTMDHGTYSIKIKRFTRFLRLADFDTVVNTTWSWNGDFKITKLNSKYLVIEKDQDLLEYYEFVKK